MIKNSYLGKLFLLVGLFISLHAGAQVTLTATGGTTSGSFASVNAAFTAINAGTHQGVIVIFINGNTTEGTFTTLSASGQGTASYTSITIKPTVASVIAGAPGAGVAVLTFNGSDNITIDGSITVGGTTRDLTIQNNGPITQANTAAIRLIGNTTGGLGVNNCQIRNCIIIGNTPGNSGNSGSTVATSYGIYAGSTVATTMATTGAGNDYDNLTIENNLIKSAFYGICVVGSAAPNTCDNLLIRNNEIGSSNPLEQVSVRGIAATQINTGQITGNTIFGLIVNTANTNAGIELAGTASANVEITRNKLYSIYSTSTSGYGAAGILHTAGANTLMANNVIYDIRTTNYSSTSFIYQATGIRMVAGTGLKLYYNSIHLYGDYSAGSTVLGRSTAISLGATTITADIRNNIFANKMTSSTNPTNREFVAMWFAASFNFANVVLENNAYHLPNDGDHFIGKVGTTAGTGLYSDLATWRTISQVGAPTNDVNSTPSVNSVAPFTADNDLTIPAGTFTNIESGGVVIPSLGLPNIDFTGANRPAGTGTAPDMGAYEFNGMPIAADIGISALVKPLTSGCFTSADTIRVRLTNFTGDPLILADDPVTVYVSTTGANPVNFAPIVLNSGTIPGNGFINVTVPVLYDLSILGTHVFHAYAETPADNIPLNDTLAPVTIVISGGTMSVSEDTLCFGSTSTLSVTGQTAGGSIQWQSSPDGTTWTNVAGGTSPAFNVGPTATTYYRALICGTYASNVDTINVINIAAPVVPDVTRCGPGTALLTGTLPPPATQFNWYDVPAGGGPIHTGVSFTTPLLYSSDTYYVSATNGSIQTFTVGYINTAGYSFLTQTAGWGAMFTANTACRLDSVGVYPTGTGTISIRVLDPANNLVYAGPVTNLSGTGTQKIMIPVGAVLAPGNYKLGMASTGVTNLGSQSTGGSFAYPFVSPPLTITSGSQGTGAVAAVYYWFYDWRVSTGVGCESVRVPVNVTVTPSDTIIASALADPICEGAGTTLSITSANSNYQYTWSPATGLSSTTGSSVTGSPDSTITYTIDALDAGTNCASVTSITVNVTPKPYVNVTPGDTLICLNATLPILTDALGANIQAGVGAGTTSNTATSTTILGPYGGSYGGAKHQYLFLASELTAAGLTAGVIDYLQFNVTNVNGAFTLADYSIAMDTTSQAVLTTTFIPGLTTVYNNASFLPQAGLNTHHITPFNWDGTSNVVIEVCFNNGHMGYNSGNASVTYTATTGTNTVTYFRADTDPTVCASLTGTAGVNRPNIIFGRSAPISYQWSPVAGLSNDTIGNPVLTIVGAGDYILTVTDQFSNCSAQDTVSITTHVAPVVDLGPDSSICSNATSGGFFLDATSPGLSYEWQDGSNSPTFFVNLPGTYWVTVTNANNCQTTDTFNVSLVNPAAVDIDINVVSPSSATLDAGPGFVSYLWSNFTNNQTLNINGNGTYWVQVVDNNGCSNSDTVNIVFLLGVDENGSDLSLSFYPNPSNGPVNFSVKGLTTDNLSLHIMDMNGREVFVKQYGEIVDQMNDVLDFGNLPSGTYLVRAVTGTSVYTNRIVITK